MWNKNPNDKQRGGGWGQGQQQQQPQNNRQQGFNFQRGGQMQPGGGYAYPGYAVETTMADRSSLASKVMTFTFFSILAAMAGCWVGATAGFRFGGASWILFLVLEIGLIFAVQAFKDKMPLNFVLLYTFAAVTGLSISPVIGLLFDLGYSGIVYQALGITAGMTLALSFYAWTTKRDFSGFAPYLFAGVIGLVVVGLLNSLLFHSPLLHMIYLYAGVIIFSFYMIFDVQQVKKYQNTVGNAVMLAIGIYLNIFNLFLFILQLLLSFQSND